MNLASRVGQAARLAQETRVFGVGNAQLGDLDQSIGSAETLFYRTGMVSRITPGIYQGLVYLLVIGGLAVLSASNVAHVASLGAVVLLLVRAGAYGQQLQGGYQTVRQAAPFVERIRDVERRYEGSAPDFGNERLERVEQIAFREVRFAYKPAYPVLSGLDFTVDAGEAIGIVGPSGAGKSTLVQLLLRLREPDEGVVLVNGRPAGEFADDDWHARFAYVPQEPRLLHASVADNIRYLRDLDDAAVEQAARLACIDDDVVSWSAGYRTIVGPRADAVSGGQQQRICIARALAGQPDVLVLDEPTSALDPRSEGLLQESLTLLKANLMLFVVAHRMSTIDVCDRVLVVVGGRIEAFDAPDRLRRSNAYFREAMKGLAETAFIS
jgi:ABC-type multidrug transport system fused ATPase/permease subunit